tara:strand:+ start:765 stop:950 length:186 start_codon:yes stop_codon:yes gene_type:complete
MKTKLKNLTIYSLAVIGAISLFLSAKNYTAGADEIVDTLEDINSSLQDIRNQLNSGIQIYQ